MNKLLIDEMLTIRRIDDQVHPMNQSGLYLTREQWIDLRDGLDRFFDTFSDNEIAIHNELLKRQPWAQRNEKSSKGNDGAGYVYLLHHNGLYKIGLTKNMDRRLGQISPKMPHDVTLIHAIGTEDMVGLEKHFHELFAYRRLNGEWFALTPDDVSTFTKG